MKRPVVGELDFRRDMSIWRINQHAYLYRTAFLKDGEYMISWGEEVAGPISKQMAQELFYVLLYPPGSVPSPESADPTHKHRIQEDKHHNWDIPRQDIENGDWN